MLARRSLTPAPHQIPLAHCVATTPAASWWAYPLDALVPFVARMTGGITGVVSGAYPALRATRREPVEPCAPAPDGLRALLARILHDLGMRSLRDVVALAGR